MNDLYLYAGSLLANNKTIQFHKMVGRDKGRKDLAVIIGRRCIAPFPHSSFFTGIWDGKAQHWLEGNYDLTWDQAVRSLLTRSRKPVSERGMLRMEVTEDFCILGSPIPLPPGGIATIEQLNPAVPTVPTRKKRAYTCSSCGKKGHSKRFCEEPKKAKKLKGSRPTGLKYKCSLCEQQGHTKNRCPLWFYLGQ